MAAFSRGCLLSSHLQASFRCSQSPLQLFIFSTRSLSTSSRRFASIRSESRELASLYTRYNADPASFTGLTNPLYRPTDLRKWNAARKKWETEWNKRIQQHEKYLADLKQYYVHQLRSKNHEEASDTRAKLDEAEAELQQLKTTFNVQRSEQATDHGAFHSTRTESKRLPLNLEQEWDPAKQQRNQHAEYLAALEALQPEAKMPEWYKDMKESRNVKDADTSVSSNASPESSEVAGDSVLSNAEIIPALAPQKTPKWLGWLGVKETESAEKPFKSHVLAPYTHPEAAARWAVQARRWWQKGQPVEIYRAPTSYVRTATVLFATFISGYAFYFFSQLCFSLQSSPDIGLSSKMISVVMATAFGFMTFRMYSSLTGAVKRITVIPNRVLSNQVNSQAAMKYNEALPIANFTARVEAVRVTHLWQAKPFELPLTRVWMARPLSDYDMRWDRRIFPGNLFTPFPGGIGMLANPLIWFLNGLGNALRYFVLAISKAHLTPFNSEDGKHLKLDRAGWMPFERDGFDYFIRARLIDEQSLGIVGRIFSRFVGGRS